MIVRFVLALALGAALLDAGAAGIFRCRSAEGGTSYQESPCAPGSDAARLAVPGEFPPANLAARERLLDREAALDRRLEAQRERLSREETARIAARAQVAAAEAAAAPVADPVYVAAWPVYPWRAPLGSHRGHRGHSGHPWPRGIQAISR
jgi:hypothetical protein